MGQGFTATSDSTEETRRVYLGSASVLLSASRCIHSPDSDLSTARLLRPLSYAAHPAESSSAPVVCRCPSRVTEGASTNELSSNITLDGSGNRIYLLGRQFNSTL
jgi:hypothetical protein